MGIIIRIGMSPEVEFGLIVVLCGVVALQIAHILEINMIYMVTFFAFSFLLSVAFVIALMFALWILCRMDAADQEIRRFGGIEIITNRQR